MMSRTGKISNPVTVAYADDHVAVRKSIVSYIHDLGGIEVIIEANNGKALIEQMEQRARKPDICMLDINMPEMNGFETVAVLKQKWKDMKVLILSTYTEDMYVVRMIRAGVNGFLSKACDPEEIKEALLRIHQQGHYYSGLYIEKAILAAQDNKLKIPNLTEKELTFLELCCSEMTYSKMARHMKCTSKSVEGYRDSLFKKLQVNSRVSLALFAVRTGIVLIDSSPIQ